MAVERIVDDPARAAAVIAAGGELGRHSVVMVLDLADARPLPSSAAGFRIDSMDAARVAEYGDVVVRAYPPEHPDHEPSDADPAAASDGLARYLRGEEIGPWVADASLHVTDRDRRVVGLILVNETTATESFDAGPFVTDLCVDPAVAGNGIGRALLIASARRLADLGWSKMILVVTVGNPAQHIYERLGFRVFAESWRFEIDD
jgi:ribosomal protein S18 acetylase RimI-like enzyme